MKWDDVGRLATTLDGVRATVSNGRREWRYHGRLVAREIDDDHLVIRAEFEYRDFMVREFPGTFTVPTRYRKHMMLVAQLSVGNPASIEDALVSAWELQRAHD